MVLSQCSVELVLKGCMRTEAHGTVIMHAGFEPVLHFSVYLSYHDTVCMCTSQTPIRKISLKWKLTCLCVNLLEHEPKNFLQWCQSTAPSLALMTADRGSYSVSFEDYAI